MVFDDWLGVSMLYFLNHYTLLLNNPNTSVYTFIVKHEFPFLLYGSKASVRTKALLDTSSEITQSAIG